MCAIPGIEYDFFQKLVRQWDFLRVIETLFCASKNTYSLLIAWWAWEQKSERSFPVDLERVINLLDIVLGCNGSKEVRRTSNIFCFSKIGCVGFDFLPHTHICKYIFNNGVAAFNISWSNICSTAFTTREFWKWGELTFMKDIYMFVASSRFLSKNPVQDLLLGQTCICSNWVTCLRL